MIVDLYSVFATFRCPNCDKEIPVSFANVIEVGTPICDSCDWEMELANNKGRFINFSRKLIQLMRK